MSGIHPTRDTWDKVSESYKVEIDDSEKKLADEIYSFMENAEIFPPSKIIELGCGSGHLSACLAMKGYDVTLLDFSKGALDKARKTFEKYNLNGTFIEGDIFDLYTLGQKYDLAWNSGVMEHFDSANLSKVYSSVMSITTEKFIFLVPNAESISYLLMRYYLQGKGEWTYGQEYLRNDYLDIAANVNLSGQVLGYAASSISKWHFESVFHNHINSTIYSQMIEDGIIPQNESYLTVYCLSKMNTFSNNIYHYSNESLKEKYFEISAQYFQAKQQNKQLNSTISAKNEEIDVVQKQLQECQILLQGNAKELTLKSNEISELEKKIIAACEREKSHIKEIENLNAEVQRNIEFDKTISHLNDTILENKAYMELLSLKLHNKELDLEAEKEKIKNALTAKEEELKAQTDELTKISELYKKEQQISSCYLSHTENIIKVLYPQVIKEVDRITEDINKRSFAIMTRIHAVGCHWKNTSLMGKAKLIVKLILRPFGFKRHLYYEYESPYCNISNSLKNIRSLSTMIRTEIPEAGTNLNAVENTLMDYKFTNSEILVSNPPLISVLLPVYNHACFICDAIEAVQGQTYSNWELIIINDGSTDDLLERIENYAGDPRIKIYSQDNQRLPNTLTNLHGLATGEFITWTSADNVMEPEMLEELCQNLVKHPNVSMVFADVSIIDDKGNFLSSGYREFNRDKEFPYIMRLPHSTDALDAECDNFINACFMYRGDFARALQGHYSADLEGLEDYDFWLRLKSFGSIYHIKNTKPLYRYRVHKNTMSEDLLKNKREQHIRRSQKLMEFSKLRNEYSARNWHFVFDDNKIVQEEIIKVLNSMHYDYLSSNGKIVYIYDDITRADLCKNAMCVVVNSHYYDIYHLQDGLKPEKRNHIYRGIDIPVISQKVRQTYIEGLFWEYPVQYVNMPVIGCHLDLNAVDIEKTEQFVNLNPDKLFVFCPVSGSDYKTLEKQLMSRCNNVIILNERQIGTQIYLYASWDMMFVPPLKNQEVDIMESIALAWNIGRWIFIENQNNVSGTLPIVCNYDYREKLIGIKKIEEISEIEEILNSYINRFSTQGCINYLLKCLNGIGQDIFVKRPDFEIQVKERKFPPARMFQNNLTLSSAFSRYIAIMVDTLDKGGLEQVVSLLVQELIKRKINVKVFCTEHGGVLAEQLQASGVEVIIFNGQRENFLQYIKNNRPLLVNTHYTKKMLDLVHAQNIPIVEVIHNMYVFFSDNDWKAEFSREAYFTKMIAVSELVKETYLTKNPHVPENKIIVIGNAADSNKIYGKDREFIRSILGIEKSSTVFINVSSIDGRKNQLGLLSAFDYYYNTYNSDSYLILVGNVLSEYYNNEISGYLAELSSKDHIIKLPYYREIADLYYASDIFVMPSYFEGWSIAATEALYCGLPVIHSRCGSAIELTDNGNNGIIISNPAGNISHISAEKLNETMGCRVPENTDELIHAMKSIADNLSVWEKKKASNAAKNLMKYSVKNMIDSYIDCFTQIIGNL